MQVATPALTSAKISSYTQHRTRPCKKRKSGAASLVVVIQKKPNGWATRPFRHRQKSPSSKHRKTRFPSQERLPLFVQQTLALDLLGRSNGSGRRLLLLPLLCCYHHEAQTENH